MMTEQYTGIDNLEVMEQAVFYNDYLISLVTSRADDGCEIIDFGAGSGTFSKILQKKGYLIHCVEADGALAQRLRRDGLVVSENIAEYPGSVDFIYSFNVLEHIEDDQRTLEQLYEKLRPGGVIVMYVPAFQLLYSSMDKKVGHFRRYRIRDLERKMQLAGFSIDKSQYVDSIGFFASLWYRFFGREDGRINVSALRIYDKWFFPLSLRLDLLVGKMFGKNLLLIARKS